MKNLLTSLLCTQNTFFHRSNFMVFRDFVRQSTKTYSIPSFQFCKSHCNCVSMEKAFVILPQNIRNTFGFTCKYFPESFWLHVGIYSNWLRLCIYCSNSGIVLLFLELLVSRQPTPVFLPGESQGRRSLVGWRLWGCTESDTTEVT